MRAAAPEFLTPGQLKCMVAAKNQEDVQKCLPQNKKNLVVKASGGAAAYTDTLSVSVLTYEINGSISSPTAGWNVGGSFLVDVVTAASPDIVSEASPPFHETRYAGTLSGGYKPGKFGVQANGGVSSTPDYLSVNGGIAFTADLRDKLLTPRIGYNYSHDTIGRTNTPFSIYSKNLDTQEIEAGLTFVLSPTSLLLVSGTLAFERGDQSKPYRYVPMFAPLIAGLVQPGQSIDSVNLVRLPMRPLEQLPTSRDRYALGARFAKRFSSSTLRLEERLYYDSWQTKASTTDMRFLMDLSRHFRIWPHARFHAQSGTNFYQLAYSAEVIQGNVVLPTYRTDDRELSPLFTITGGGGTRIGLSAPEAKNQFGLTIQGDVAYTQFLNALFITRRTAVYGSLNLDAEFD